MESSEDKEAKQNSVAKKLFDQESDVASGVVALRHRQQAKLPPGAIPKMRRRKPPLCPDGENILWEEDTLNIDPVSDLEQNVIGQKQVTKVVTGKPPFCRGLQQHQRKPSHNKQKKLLKQGGDTQPTKSRETPAPKVTCVAHQAKLPGAKPKKHPNELPQSPEDKKLCVQIPNNSEFLTQPSLPLYSNQQPILHDRPNHQPSEAKYLSPPSRRFGEAREASSEDDSDDSGRYLFFQENKSLRLNAAHLVQVNRILTEDLQKQSKELLCLKDQAETSRPENAQLLGQKGALEQENNELKQHVTELLAEITANMETIRMAEATIRHLAIVIDQLVSRNASGIRVVVDNQTSGCASDYQQLPGSAVDFSSQEATAEGETINTNNQLGKLF